MADYAYSDGGWFETEGANTTTSLGTTVTASASTNTKGAYSQLVASTGSAANGFILCISPNAIADILVDVAVGAAGSEQVIVPNLYVRAGVTVQVITCETIYIPISIPAGSRVAMRSQSGTANAALQATITLVGGSYTNMVGFQSWDSIGTSTATSKSTEFQLNGVAVNTKSAWQQLTASTTRQYKAVIIGVTPILTNTQVSTLIDFGTGAAGSETVVIPNFFTNFPASTTTTFLTGPIPWGIPAGTRLAFRLQVSNNPAGNWYSIALYGLY